MPNELLPWNSNSIRTVIPNKGGEEMLNMMSICIAAAQVREYIEANCQKVRILKSPPQYILGCPRVEVELERHLKLVSQYRQWILGLTKIMHQEGCLNAFGYYPVLSEDLESVSFHAPSSF